jgi:hypothetical protein
MEKLRRKSQGVNVHIFLSYEPQQSNPQSLRCNTTCEHSQYHHVRKKIRSAMRGGWISTFDEFNAFASGMNASKAFGKWPHQPC